MKKVLVIAPHPDDEVLGCGGTIRKYSKEKAEVYVLIVTKGSPRLYEQTRIVNIRKEALDAHEILGVKETRFLDFPAPDLDITSQADISMSISEVIRQWDIQVLFLPHRGDIHHDHRIVFQAGLVAARPNAHCPVKTIYSYETLSETEWAAPFASEVFIPNYFVDISGEMEDKLLAMSMYASQLREFPSSRSLKTIEALATFRGSTAGFERGEAFMLIRQLEQHVKL